MTGNLRLVHVAVLVALAFTAGCTGESGETAGQADIEDIVKAKSPRKFLSVKWQRLVDEGGQTCDRCGSTEVEVEEAVALLRSALDPLGIDVALNETSLSPAECAKDISQSNRVWVAGISLEDWLGARVGSSVCEGCCDHMEDCLETDGGGVECRTVIVGNNVYEAIPADLILKAGLLAAAELLSPGGNSACCPGGTCAEPGGNRVFTR